MGLMKSLTTGGGGGSSGGSTFSLKIDAAMLQHVKNLLKDLPNKARKQGLRSAATKSMAHIRKAVKALLPNKNSTPYATGLLKKAIQSTVKVYSNGYIYGAVGANRNVVGIDKEGRKRWPIKYIHLVERGVKPHDLFTGASLRKNIQTSEVGYEKHPGMEGKGFMRKAFDSKSDKAIRLFGTQFTAWFNKWTSKAAARRPK